MSRRNQAHRLPPEKWDKGLFVVCLFATILIVVTFLDPSLHF